MFANKLSETIIRNRNKHIYITDTLLQYALKNFPFEKVLIASKLSYCVEHAYWCIDDLVDMEFQKKEKYRTLFSQLWFIRLFHYNLLNLDITIENKKEILDKIINVEKELWLLADREEEAKQTAKNDIEKAIYSVLYGKSFHAEIYVIIFNIILETDKFKAYLFYRMIELLYKDILEKDILEDTRYNNLSVGTLILNKLKNKEIYNEESIELIKKISNKLYDRIKEPYFKSKAKKTIEDLSQYLKKLNFYEYIK